MFLLIIIEFLFSTLIIINLKIYKMSKTEIKNPLQKPIFKSFINQFIQIHYFQKGGEESREIENLKTLFFPPEHTEQLYKDLVSFVKTVIDKIVLKSL